MGSDFYAEFDRRNKAMFRYLGIGLAVFSGLCILFAIGSALFTCQGGIECHYPPEVVEEYQRCEDRYNNRSWDTPVEVSFALLDECDAILDDSASTGSASTGSPDEVIWCNDYVMSDQGQRLGVVVKKARKDCATDS